LLSDTVVNDQLSTFTNSQLLIQPVLQSLQHVKALVYTLMFFIRLITICKPASFLKTTLMKAYLQKEPAAVSSTKLRSVPPGKVSKSLVRPWYIKLLLPAQPTRYIKARKHDFL
jgi:hypothetical protein